MHSKNSTTPDLTQQPKLRACSFGGVSRELFSVQEETDLIGALKLASDLAEGIEQLCSRLDDSINDGEIAYCCEIRALGFLGNVVSALTRAAGRGLELASEVETKQ